MKLKITVRFYGVVYDNTGVREWNPELKEAATISDLLNQIVGNFPSLHDLVNEDNGLIRDFLVISVNNVDIHGLDGVNTVLRDSDTVFLAPPIGGG